MTKRCTLCRKLKSLEAFSKRTMSVDGRAGQCLACGRLYWQKIRGRENPKRRRERRKLRGNPEWTKITKRHFVIGPREYYRDWTDRLRWATAALYGNGRGFE